MADKEKQLPYVSQTVQRLKARLNGEDNVEKVNQRRDMIKDAVDLGLKDFLSRLQSGDVEIKTVADFERLTKIAMLLNGDPTERVESTNNAVASEEEEIFSELQNTPAFEELRKRMADQLNRRNEGLD